MRRSKMNRKPYTQLKGVSLMQLRADWLAHSQKPSTRRFDGVQPIDSIALIGATIKEKLALEDEMACRAILRAVIPHIPLSNDCIVDLYDPAQNNFYLPKNRTYDLAIFCDMVPETFIPENMNCRFIASYGIPCHEFGQPVFYDLSQSPGERLLQRYSFMTTQRECGFNLMDGFPPAASAYLPYSVNFTVRNDVLEAIATTNRPEASTSILFKEGIETFEKLDLLAKARQNRGRQPTAREWQVYHKSIEDLQTLVARPLTRVERAEKALRQLIP